MRVEAESNKVLLQLSSFDDYSHEKCSIWWRLRLDLQGSPSSRGKLAFGWAATTINGRSQEQIYEALSHRDGARPTAVVADIL